MKIHSMCLVKNEADIIAQSLKAASKWSDFIYVFDNGSSDSTWEKVLSLSQECPKIIPFKQENKPFNDKLRAEIFNYYRNNSSEEDWWLRLDADEIYIDDPRIFLAKIPPKYQMVIGALFVYYFTDKDLESYTKNPSLYDDHVPIEQRSRYYLNDWADPRCFRYKNNLSWDENTGDDWPSAIFKAPIYPIKIWIKHYQYRSPKQIQKRLETRSAAIAKGKFIHEARPNWDKAVESLKTNSSLLAKGYKEADLQYATTNWQERLVNSSAIDYDAHDGKYIVREDLMPKYRSKNNLIPEYNHKFKLKKFLVF